MCSCICNRSYAFLAPMVTLMLPFLMVVGGETGGKETAEET